MFERSWSAGGVLDTIHGRSRITTGGGSGDSWRVLAIFLPSFARDEARAREHN